MVHGVVDASLASGGPLRGALFWQWDAEGGARPSPSSVFQVMPCSSLERIISILCLPAPLQRPGSAVVCLSPRVRPCTRMQKDSTFQKLITPFAKKVTAGGGAPMPGCAPRSSPTPNATQPEVQSFSGAGRRLLARHS